MQKALIQEILNESFYFMNKMIILRLQFLLQQKQIQSRH